MQQFRPKKMDIFKEENIVFDDEALIQDNKEDDAMMSDQETDIKAIQYRKRFEEALIQIEDQEDV